MLLGELHFSEQIMQMEQKRVCLNVRTSCLSLPGALETDSFLRMLVGEILSYSSAFSNFESREAPLARRMYCIVSEKTTTDALSNFALLLILQEKLRS